MTEIICNDKTYRLYSSIKELPIILSKKSNAYLLQEVGIGSQIADVDEHLAKLLNFMHSDKKVEAMEEAKNLRFNLFSMLSGINYKSLAFGCLIHSVDGEEIKDHSEENLIRMSDGLSGQEIEAHFNQVKKNWLPNEN